MCVSLKLYIVLVFQFLYYTEPACGFCSFCLIVCILSSFEVSLFFLQFKLCKVRSVQFGSKGIPYIDTDDGRSIRYPDPLIKANDTIKLDLESNKIVNFIKFDDGNVVMVTGGRNTGRVGILKNRVKGY
ncbi:putative ribosomal protein S4e [Helianthus annuus]|nr:putative ribosomal protein S4e [Helianthus annuus]